MSRSLPEVHSLKEKTQAVKLIKSSGLQFSGEDKEENREEFLERLEDCRDGAGLPDAHIIGALPSVLRKRAARWFRTIQADTIGWDEFVREFRRQLIRECDEEDLLGDLRHRMQGKGEKVSAYLSCFKYIVTRFKFPPPEGQQVKYARQNLLPEYANAMMGKRVESLDDIEKYGRR